MYTKKPGKVGNEQSDEIALFFKKKNFPKEKNSINKMIKRNIQVKRLKRTHNCTQPDMNKPRKASQCVLNTQAKQNHTRGKYNYVSKSKNVSREGVTGQGHGELTEKQNVDVKKKIKTNRKLKVLTWNISGLLGRLLDG